MTAFMLDMMVAMMPYMKPILYLGGAAAIVGLVAMFARPFFSNAELRQKVLLWSGRTAAGVGIFFFACQIMGAILGAAPQFNLGDSSKFEFIMVPFWQAGAALFLAALLVGNSGASSRR